jgi:outer membrane lipoprotein-sorting protein
MNTIKSILAVLALVAAAATPAFAQEMDAASILKKVDEIRSPSDNFVFTVKVHSQTASSEDDSELEVLVHNGTQSLVLYRQPVKQRGRALLLDGPNMWIYIPGTSRPLRISPQQQLTGTVSNADVARVVFHLDYTADSAQKDRLDDLQALKLDLHARQSSVTYQSIQLWVAEKDLHPLKADFFSLSGKLLRSIQYGGYQTILGQERPTVLQITDAINPAVKATLSYSNFKNQNTPEEYYQPSYLEKLAN